VALQAETYNEYVRIAKPVRMNPSRVLRLIKPMLDHGYVDSAEHAINVLLRAAPDSAQLPGLLVLLTKALHNAGRDVLARKYHALLLEQFPQSAEARLLGSAR